MAYFDNAATTYPKPGCVYDFMNSFYRTCGASAGRGSYKLAKSAGALIQDTRKRLQELLHCESKQIVFEPTATIALNVIIQGMIAKGARNIYISPFEHNAVTRTLHHFEEAGQITVRQLSVSKEMVFDLEKIRYQFDQEKPDFVIVSHAGNVFGLVAPVEDIFRLSKGYGAVNLVDMSQSAGLVDLNVGLSTIDFAVFADRGGYPGNDARRFNFVGSTFEHYLFPYRVFCVDNHIVVFYGPEWIRPDYYLNQWRTSTGKYFNSLPFIARFASAMDQYACSKSPSTT